MLLELKAVPLCDAVIHLAGEPIAQRWTSEAKKRIRESRILRTRDLVDGIGQLPHKPGVFISASAIGYYGNRGNEVLTEESAPGKDFLADVCVHWEEEADRAREFGLRVVKVRNGMVLGEDGGALKRLLPLFRMGLGGRLGSGKQWVSWIHRDDLLRMLIWAAANPNIAGVLNGTAPEPVTNAQFTRDLAQRPGKTCHHSRPSVRAPPGAGRNVGCFVGQRPGYSRRRSTTGVSVCFQRLTASPRSHSAEIRLTC